MPMTRRTIASVITAGFLATGISAQVQPARSPESFLSRMLRIAGLTSAPSQMRGPADEVLEGNVWVVNTGRGAARALTSDGGYRSPIFLPDGAAVLAIRAGAIVKLSLQGSRTIVVKSVPQATKLVGVDAANPAEVVMLVDVPGAPIASVSLQSGQTTWVPFDASAESDRRMLAQIRAQERTYGDTSVYTRAQTKPGLTRAIEWVDVFVSRGSAPPKNVSGCDGVSCVQPSLSPDGQTIAFVKADN
jgi:hypothetical protein